MNIIVKTASGHIVVRPDTTWERDNEDLYLPDSVTALSYAPVLFARISKPGRSISRKFAARYYDAVNYGVLLYPEDYMDGSEEGYACASCLDHTSFLPSPFYQPIVLGNEGNVFNLRKNDKTVFSTEGETLSMIEEALEEATSRIYIRTGDILAIELKPKEHIYDRSEGNVLISGDYCGNRSVDFKIIVE